MVDALEQSPHAQSSLPAQSLPQRVVLTGFMGAGKSTVGRLFATRARWNFIDLDTHMESTTGKSAPELFRQLGEAGFRRLETEQWALVLRRSSAIIAPGGAVIDKPENQRLLAESGASLAVFLDAPFPVLIARCLQQEREQGATYRPLLHKTEIARARYEDRRVLYAKHAHHMIDVENKSPEDVADSLWNIVFPPSDRIPPL